MDQTTAVKLSYCRQELPHSPARITRIVCALSLPRQAAQGVTQPRISMAPGGRLLVGRSHRLPLVTRFSCAVGCKGKEGLAHVTPELLAASSTEPSAGVLGCPSSGPHPQGFKETMFCLTV